MTPYEKWTLILGGIGVIGAVLGAVWKILREFNKSVDTKVSAAIDAARSAIVALFDRHTAEQEIQLQQIEEATRETRDDVKDMRERLIAMETRMEAMETERRWRHEAELARAMTPAPGTYPTYKKEE